MLAEAADQGDGSEQRDEYGQGAMDVLFGGQEMRGHSGERDQDWRQDAVHHADCGGGDANVVGAEVCCGQESGGEGGPGHL